MKLFSKAIVVVVLVSVAAAAVAGAVVYFGATRWKSPEAREIAIRPGTSLRGIASQLHEERVIGTPKLFEMMARARGLGRTLRAGTYEFPAGSTLPSVLDKLAAGDVKEYAFTVIEGWTIDDIAAALSGQPYLARADVPSRFAKLAKDPAFAASMGIADAPSLEGYLFPDTYFVEKPLEASTLIRLLVGQFERTWASLDRSALSRAPLTEAEIVTLASIVEKEAGAPEERPLVAAVFLNRLKKGMPLQSDPTIIYGLQDFDGNIRKRDITNPHPYNTYVHAGLPPGPIANPGKASLQAVLAPARVDYLYFVSKGNGTHHFSTTLSEHLAAVRKYQLQKP